MKIFDTITQLTQQGFSVNRTPQLTTIFEHQKPFLIEGIDSNWINAVQTEQGYQVVFASLCPTDKLPKRIAMNENTTTLMGTIINSSKTIKSNDTNPQKKQKTPVLFKNLDVGKTFKLSEGASIVYKKIGVYEYINTSPLALKVSLITSDDNKEVYAMNENLDTSLSLEQKMDLVSFIEPGLDKAEFIDQLAPAFEDIPGLEFLTGDQLSALYDELYTLYLQ